jgi:hypothetical protein
MSKYGTQRILYSLHRVTDKNRLMGEMCHQGRSLIDIFEKCTQYTLYISEYMLVLSKLN